MVLIFPYIVVHVFAGDLYVQPTYGIYQVRYWGSVSTSRRHKEDTGDLPASGLISAGLLSTPNSGMPYDVPKYPSTVVSYRMYQSYDGLPVYFSATRPHRTEPRLPGTYCCTTARDGARFIDSGGYRRKSPPYLSALSFLRATSHELLYPPVGTTSVALLCRMPTTTP